MKKISLISVAFVLVILVSTLASAEFWACFNRGEQIHYCEGYKPDWTCGSSSGCEKCMSVYNETEDCYIHGVWYKCNALPRICSDLGGNHTIDSEPPEITLNSPIQDEIYDSRSVLIDISLNEEADISYYDNVNGRGRWTRVCRDCYDYSRARSFDEGFNDITFKAVDAIGNTAYEDVTFTVDSKEPRIRGTKPRRGFASGLFEVEFKEENPENLTLYYGNNLIGWRNSEVDLNNCTENRNTKCNITVPFNDYDGQEIEYYFVLKDIAGSEDESKHEEIKVDITAPIINSAEYISNRRDEIVVNVTEVNLDEIEYIDRNDDRARWRSLCRRLDREDGLCHGRVRFDDGLHNVTIKAKDEAGLETYYEMDEFFTDSHEPRIRGTKPRRGFASGLFEVEFKEENPEELWLNYGNNLIGWRNSEVDLNNCWEERRNTKCDINVDLDDYDGQEIEYWFNITDIVGNYDESRERDLDVDTTAPVINYFNWTQGEGIYERYIYFTFNITEENFDEITYSYNDTRGRLREKRLCSRLDKEDRDSDTGICEKRRSFREGEYLINVKVLDEAGNEISEDIGEYIAY